jgi:hypothetical protein
MPCPVHGLCDGRNRPRSGWVEKYRNLCFSIASFLVVSFAATDLARADECTADAAWSRVRQVFPIHNQALARCDDPATGRAVVVLTEPPPHIRPNKAEEIIKALFTVPSANIESVQKRRHPLGFDGWAEDLIIVVNAADADTKAQLDESLALLAALAFGSTYKAEIYDIKTLAPPQGLAPPPAGGW